MISPRWWSYRIIAQTVGKLSRMVVTCVCEQRITGLSLVWGQGQRRKLNCQQHTDVCLTTWRKTHCMHKYAKGTCISMQREPRCLYVKNLKYSFLNISLFYFQIKFLRFKTFLNTAIWSDHSWKCSAKSNLTQCTDNWPTGTERSRQSISL